MVKIVHFMLIHICNYIHIYVLYMFMYMTKIAEAGAVKRDGVKVMRRREETRLYLWLSNHVMT